MKDSAEVEDLVQEMFLRLAQRGGDVATHERVSGYVFETAASVLTDRARRPVEAFVYPDEYHTKWQPAHRAAIYQRNLDWLVSWLQDTEDLASAPQYERWRAMRDAAR